MATRRRLDLEMARRGLAPSREGAQRLIMAGRVRVNSQPALKADQSVDERSTIALVGGSPEYASRGGIKLAAALDHFGVDPAGRRAMDVGASTGGFTDVLLRRGAAHVVALDVGYGQIAERLRRDSRVTVLDRTNIRLVEASSLPYAPEIVVIDVSFISLRLVLPPVSSLARLRSKSLRLSSHSSRSARAKSARAESCATTPSGAGRSTKCWSLLRDWGSKWRARSRRRFAGPQATRSFWP